MLIGTQTLFQKTEKKVVKPESEKEKLKPRSDDIPTTSTSTPMAVETKPNGSRTTEEPLKRMGKSGDDGSQEPQGIRHPAIFSTKIGDEAAAAAAGASPSTSAPSTSTSVQTKTTTSPTKSPTSTTITTSGTTTSATSSVATAPPPVLHAMRSASTPATSSQLTGGGGGNPRESSWQTAAYV